MIRATRVRSLLATVVLTATAAAGAVAVQDARAPFGDDRYTVLVMGSDQGPWRPGSVFDGRSDALHLVVVTPSASSASILSFPRDLYVPVPGFGTTRINDALTRGPDNAVATVEDLVGIEVDDWIVTSMSGFVRAMDAYGGLEVDVPQQLRVDDRVVEPGRQRLDGYGALVYGRDRKSRSDGDLGRNRAQAEMLALLQADLRSRGPSPTELLGHVLTLRRHTVSSIPPARMVLLADVALDIDPAKVVREQVPGVDTTRGGAAVLAPTSGAETLYADLRDDGMLTP